jgi:Ser/Thr protein kinase RdoA (MazF antagonist)
VVPTRTGSALHADREGGAWRAFDFVEGTRSVDAVESPDQAFEAARAFGGFAAQLADLPGPRLHDSIPHFHDLPRRVAALERGLEEDSRGRARSVDQETHSLRVALGVLEGRLPHSVFAGLPRRIAHHDCKLNNLLLDARSGEALCVIDLDTVMEGSLLSDFGGLVRTATCRAAEDERDLDQIDFDQGLFEALAAGYLEGTSGLLVAEERGALHAAGTLLTLLDATRFLTDHLQGDVYFRIQREGQNLDRARAQLRLAERMLERCDEMAALVDGLPRSPRS